jgi:hypothetical protein
LTNRNRIFIWIVVLVVVMALPLLAYSPQGGGQGLALVRGGGNARGPQPPPTNLLVLPKSWTRQQVVQVMQAFTMGLGVQCNYCHAEQAGACDPDQNAALEGTPTFNSSSARIGGRYKDWTAESLGHRRSKSFARFVIASILQQERGQKASP